MLSLLFVIIGLILIGIQTKRENSLINLITLFVGPYVVIVLINNLFAYKAGFYIISSNVLLMLMSTFFFFTIGTYIATPTMMPRIEEADNDFRVEQYRMNGMINVLLIIGVIGIFKLLLTIRAGSFSSSGFESSEGLMGLGIVGHALLLSYSISPIVFLYWIDHKKNLKALVSIILIAVVTFSSFIKYNILGFVVSLFIFVTIYKKSIARKGLIILIGSVAGIFVLNYFLGFILRGISVQSSFYTNQFWDYTAGSVIYDNYIFRIDLEGSGNSLFYRLGTFIFALPNMFLNRFFGFTVFPHVQKAARQVGTMYGQTSNVVDAIGYLFPKGDVFQIIIFYFLQIVFGVLFMRIYCRQMRKNRFNTFSCNFSTYFVFFSFFGNFYINSAPWEILVYSLIIPNLFLIRTNVLKGRISL